MALVDLIRGKGKAAVGGLAGVLQAANSANPMEQNTYGQPIPPAPKWVNFLMNSGNAIANAVMAPSNALAGKYDQIVVGPDGKVLSMIDPRMMDDAATLSGLLTTGAMPIPKPAGSLGMGGGKMANRAFKEWFGGSKVVDDAGNPLVVYHGGSNNIEAFRPNQDGLIYSTSDPNLAGDYAAARYSGSGSIYPLHASLKNPMIVDRLEDATSQKELVRRAKENGYDGLILKNADDSVTGRPQRPDSTIVIAFSPRQIKSAIGNRGTFDPNDPNILRAGGIPMIPMPTDQKDQQ